MCSFHANIYSCNYFSSLILTELAFDNLQRNDHKGLSPVEVNGGATRKERKNNHHVIVLFLLLTVFNINTITSHLSPPLSSAFLHVLVSTAPLLFPLLPLSTPSFPPQLPNTDASKPEW